MEAMVNQRKMNKERQKERETNTQGIVIDDKEGKHREGKKKETMKKADVRKEKRRK